MMTSIIAGMAITVFGIRYLFIGMAGLYRLPQPIEKTLSFSPPVVLGSIVVSTITSMLEEQGDFESTAIILVSLFAAFSLALYKRNLLLALGVGMSLYAVLQVIYF